MYPFSVGVALMVVLVYGAAPTTISHEFILVSRHPAHSPLRLANTTSWSGVYSQLRCAHLTLKECPLSRGFLHDPESALCRPLGLGTESVSDVPGNIYIARPDCEGEGFQGSWYVSDRQITCLRRWSLKVPYQNATATCNALGGHLASVKTKDKLEVVASMSSGCDLWVGMDDLAEEGKHIWQNDGTELTLAQKREVFQSTEPNDYEGKEDCISFWIELNVLNDQPCWLKKCSLCEKDLPVADC